MSNLFWLTDEQLVAIEAAIPKKRRGVKPRRNPEVISGIIHRPDLKTIIHQPILSHAASNHVRTFGSTCGPTSPTTRA